LSGGGIPSVSCSSDEEESDSNSSLASFISDDVGIEDSDESYDPMSCDENDSACDELSSCVSLSDFSNNINENNQENNSNASGDDDNSSNVGLF